MVFLTIKDGESKYGQFKRSWELDSQRGNVDQIDNELESRARELLAYLDTDLAIEESLPFAVGYLVEKMRAAVFAKAARTLAPAHVLSGLDA